MNVTANRRAEEFHRLLEHDRRSDDPVTGPMVAVVDALRAVPTVPGPRAEFRTALRQRLVAVATVQGAGAPEQSTVQRVRSAGSTWKVQRRLSALAAGAAVVTGVVGIGVGASRSLPGQPLYGVKRAAEDAQLATTVGTEARGKRHLEFARTRLGEVEALAGDSSAIGPAAGAHALAAALPSGGGRAQLIQDTLRAMDTETRSGANDMFQAFRASGSREPLTALNGFAREQYATLHALTPSLPPAARPAATGSLTLLAVVADDTVRLAAPPTAPSGPTGSGTGTPTSPATSTPAHPKPGSSSPGAGPASTPATAPGQTSSPSTPSSTGGGIVNPVQSPSAPVLPTIPSLPKGQPPPTPLPSELPTLPDLSGLLGH